MGAKLYAQYAQVPERLAIRIRDEFMPKAAMAPGHVSGIAAIMTDAISFKLMQIGRAHV